MVLDAAINGRVALLISHNVSDFARAVSTVDIAVATPAQTLEILRNRHE